MKPRLSINTGLMDDIEFSQDKRGIVIIIKPSVTRDVVIDFADKKLKNREPLP